MAVRHAPLVALALLAALAACAPSRPPAAIDPLPGAPPFAPELRAQLTQALAARGRDYQARTRHRRADGAPRFTNRLLLDPSPYLQQHAHNPVNWYPWGDEAFARARAESKPILLSVGYSTCHWCHVMEEESFEDEEIAAYLNEHYVAIKVDREVRPDVDDVYMTAVQMLTGRGGWPMTVWLTPGGQPFYGGTYFPPRDGVRGERVGFLTRLRELHEVFTANPMRVAAQADEITLRLQDEAAPSPADALPGAGTLRTAFARYHATFDAVHGGFGKAPKFPVPAALDFLLRYHRHTGEPRALDMVTLTLDRMAAGGIRDHLGGGFHRYATDAAWQVPHFEKMLYDNAQLALVYVAAYQATGRADLAAIAREVLDWVEREMTAPGGGFFAAVDADSGGEEGRFYTWTPAEVRAALDEPHAAAALAYFGVTDTGSLEGRSVLRAARPGADVAAELGREPAALDRLLDEARGQLLATRAARVAPHTDTKILAGWNGLAISAFARGGAVLGEPRYVERARAAARFVLGEMRVDGRLRRSHTAGTAHEEAFLDDHAFLAAGLLDLYDATFELEWLREAIALHETLLREFLDLDGGGFFLTGIRRSALLVRQKPDYDGALPSGNAAAALGLLRLAELTGDDRWREHADATLRALASGLDRAPTSQPALLAALDFRLDRPKEIVIVTPADGADGARPLVAALRAAYVPNSVLAVVAEGVDLARAGELVPLVAGKKAIGGTATAYVCEQRVCALPTADARALAAQLATVHPLPAS